ncbi:flap endonuclease GEN homolog 1-like [Pecten maximus]|uniref:flap endonuclease GEN homolog 1-like n=1 Tax=Pecten maximus TaxID=6579 RepID=UPI00145853D5|nr:flap endonuclease GEN homolog 1-like [Pecten maximus]XP_033750072.1 flap endonuclease GEN homolog 1-like [Pecten maximus]
MGVKTLWPVLEEAVDSTDRNVPIQSLQGKRVAVDLSSWIMEFQGVKVKGASVPSNLYIRSLYYRTVELLGYGVKLIFVADGTAPRMKVATMQRRQKAQHGGAAGTSEDTSRQRLRMMSEKCRELLTYLGLPFLYSDGEGEALCASLNAQGLVDGVMTSDVDAFLYGATTVYRNYCSQSGVVDVYTMEKIQEKLGLDRRAMVMIALLVGCDFCEEGLEGVGIKKALTLIDDIKKLGQDPLDRLRGWRSNEDLDSEKHCKRRGENTSNKLASPTKLCLCSWHKEYKLELKIREKALANESFPNKEIIKEYLEGHRHLESSPLTFNPIDICGVKTFMTRFFRSVNSKLGEFYSNFAFVLVQLQLHNMTEFLTESSTLTPLRITNCRKRQTVPHLEVRMV